MKKLRTAAQFQDYLDFEFSWRLKEIADMKVAVKSTRNISISERTLTRAALALLYAHWEGFVKNAATAYLNFVDCQGLKYAELKSCFVVFGVKKRLAELVESRQAEPTVAALDFLRKELGERAQLRYETAINTGSNLSSLVFKNIFLSLGMAPEWYEAKFNLIDESLLKRRNHIAHGEYIDVSPDDWRALADEVIAMLRQVKTDLENAMTLDSFKAG
ncbi:MAE_28990/MAE_18760 family HEPN-like nuclease [Paraburkholderia azotifigens]|uniref:MAE_28990/MAE_18760 family HEPN-like nuclease n=1 Tax=Paraburkholderia azotifigens TaxID=2057004 RepID=A0ABU9R396_9BURK